MPLKSKNQSLTIEFLPEKLQVNFMSILNFCRHDLLHNLKGFQMATMELKTENNCEDFDQRTKKSAEANKWKTPETTLFS